MVYTLQHDSSPSIAGSWVLLVRSSSTLFAFFGVFGEKEILGVLRI
jgi:hypothetical protein